MFKNILPQEAQISRQKPYQVDLPFRNSAFAPLAIALHSSALRLKKFIAKCYQGLKSNHTT